MAGGQGGFILFTIYFDLTFLRTDKRQNHAHQGGLACTGLTKNGSTRAWFEIERKVINDPSFFLFVCKRHIVKTNATGGFHQQRVPLLFQRVLFEFHQSLGSRENAHKLRHQTGKRAGRSLNLVHQLQESRHAAEGQSARRHTHGTPEEGNQIAQGKTKVQDEIREYGESRALHNLLPQFALRILQFVHHHRITFKRLDEHPVLHGFLQYRLHL